MFKKTEFLLLTKYSKLPESLFLYYLKELQHGTI